MPSPSSWTPLRSFTPRLPAFELDPSRNPRLRRTDPRKRQKTQIWAALPRAGCGTESELRRGAEVVLKKSLNVVRHPAPTLSDLCIGRTLGSLGHKHSFPDKPVNGAIPARGYRPRGPRQRVPRQRGPSRPAAQPRPTGPRRGRPAGLPVVVEVLAVHQVECRCSRLECRPLIRFQAPRSMSSWTTRPVCGLLFSGCPIWPYRINRVHLRPASDCIA